MEIDELDKKIINALMDDGRASLREIARKLGHSISTVQARFNRLVDEKIITGFAPIINQEMFENTVTVIVGVKTMGSKLQEIERLLSENPKIFGVYDVTGEYDAIILARFENRAKLNEFIKKLLANPHVNSTNTYVVLNTVKEENRVKLD